jgi:tripartite-type tricarboxylate transporter receptor subunit TctC
MRRLGIMIIVTVLVAVFPHHAFPQAYPTKAVSLMVAYPAGGSTDVGARIVASLAEKE